MAEEDYDFSSAAFNSAESSSVEKRKRTFEDSASDDSKRDPKRPNQSTPSLKILIPNYAAGALIGKGGANITELQNRYGARLRLSPSGEFYPGTEERIVILNGEVNQIIDLHNYIMDKVHSDATEGPGVRYRDEERGQQVKIVVPNATAGLVIGRGGTTIKSLQEESGAKIMITSRDDAKVPGERIITITGNTEQRLEASLHVISKIASDPENMLNKNLTYSEGKRGGGLGSHRGSGYGGGGDSFGNGLPSNLSALSSILGSLQQNQHKSSSNVLSSLSQQQNALAAMVGASGLGQAFGFGGGLGGVGAASFGGGQLSALQGLQSVMGNSGGVANSIKTTVIIQMEIPDILVGAILGKGGKTVHEFIQFSGAKIQFSGKNEFAPGTTDRVLTIQGDLNQTQIAHFLIIQKIMQAENELASGMQKR